MCIPSTNAKIVARTNKIDENPYIPRWYFSTSRSISIETHGRKMIQDPVKKERVNQFHVGYMTHPSLKKHRTHRE